MESRGPALPRTGTWEETSSNNKNGTGTELERVRTSQTDFFVHLGTDVVLVSKFFKIRDLNTK